MAGRVFRAARLEKWCQKWHHDECGESGSGSHNAIFKMPWLGDPRINLQDKNGKAKPYQVKQAVAAFDRSKEK